MRHLLAALVFLVLGSSTAFAQCSGDLAASQAGCTVIGIQKIPVSPQVPTNGQALTYNSTFNQWGPAAGGGGGGLSGMTVGQLPVAATSTTVTSSTPFGLTGNSTIVETTAGGLLTPSILPLATNAAFGGMKGDGTSISCVAGVCSSTSGFPITLGSTSVASGSTTTTIAGLTLTSPTINGGIFDNTQAVTNTLTIATATFTPVLTAGINQQMTLIHGSCPCTLANPTGIASAVGQTGMFDIIQSSSGSETIGTWGSQYITPGGISSLMLSTGANVIDHIPYRVIDSTHILLGPVMQNATH